MAPAAAVRQQPILSVTPLSPQHLQDITKDSEFRPPATPFSKLRSRFSRSQSPAQSIKPGFEAQRPRTSSGPTRRIEDFRGRDTKAKDDLTITSSAGTRGIAQAQSARPFNFPVPSLQTPSKAKEITITSRKNRTSSASESPAPSLYCSRDTTPLGFREHRSRLESSRESSQSRQRKDSTGSKHDHRLPLRDVGWNTQAATSTYVASTTSLQVQDLPIGMALGSPSQAPQNFQPTMPRTRSETMPTSSRSNTSYATHPQSHALPQIPLQVIDSAVSTVPSDKPAKGSKWKIFGMFGGKKTTQEESQDMERFAQATTEETEPIKLEITKGKVGRSNTITENNSRRALTREGPGLGRITTAPTADEDAFVKDSKAGPFSGVHVPEESAADVLANLQLDANNAQQERRPSFQVKENVRSQPRLDVEIPSVHMERYSVMFSQLLDSTRDLPKKVSTGNLLARRQATLDRLKTVNESIAELELEEARLGSNLQKPRRMSSPMASPSLSIFPNSSHLTPSAAAAAAGNPSRRLQRSNTSPAMLSPNKMTFPTDASRPPARSEQRWIDKNLIASPTSTLSSDTGPPTPDKHPQIISSGMKPVTNEPEWQIIDGVTSSIRMRQRSNTSRQRADSAAQHSRSAVQRVRSSTTTHHVPPMTSSPRTSNSSTISGSGSMASSTASAASSSTTISSSGHQIQQRPIPTIRIRHKSGSEPHPSGIVPGVPGGAMMAHQNASTSSLNLSVSGSGSGTSTPRGSGHQFPERSSSRRGGGGGHQYPERSSSRGRGGHQHPERSSSRGRGSHQHPERSSSRKQPTPAVHRQSGDDIMKVGMRIPISRFSTAPARRLPAEAPVKVEEPVDPELQIRTAADVSIARQISISRQQSQMLKQRLARGERRRRGEQGIGEQEKERAERLGKRGEKEREIMNAIDEKGGLLQSPQRGLMPMVVEGANRTSEYGMIEGE